MKRSGAELITRALENIGVRFTFGIPGVHNTELYDELNKSEKIKPILVTHEGNGAFMADAISRTSSSIGCMVIVPAAGMTHAMSGIGEAYLDGIPMIVVSGGYRRDTGRNFQLHQMDMHTVMKGITKKTYLISKHEEIVETVYDAYERATEGFPGPVFIEIPVEIQLFRGECDEVRPYVRQHRKPDLIHSQLEEACRLLVQAKKPALFVGWGARDCSTVLVQLAEHLGMPVSTTLQGLSVFSAKHPLHTGMGFSRAAVPAAENAFKQIDCLLAIGTSFGEIPTGSFGIHVPENLIHIDINPQAIDANYKAKVGIIADATDALPALLNLVKEHPSKDYSALATQIASDKKMYADEWMQHDSKDRVHVATFFNSLRSKLNDDAQLVVDDGNHTFLFAELFPVYHPLSYISPTDFNCMGYAVPAAIGAKIVAPQKQTAAIVGDGAFMMTCMELVTASTLGVNPMLFVFNDGELSQISQGQEIPYNRKTCTTLGRVHIEGVALATGAAYLRIANNSEIDTVIDEAIRISNEGHAVIIDVLIDYSKRTRFTQGVVKENLGRFPLTEKLRFVGRALLRKVTG